jgi:phosphoserine aminotransferase
MHGGAHGQFAALPLNLCSESQVADYVVTGFWSQRAHDEGAKQTNTSIITGVLPNTTSLAPSASWTVSPNSCFVHFCVSETIDSYEFFSEPSVPAGTVLVGDFTSTLLSRSVDISKYGVVYASGGKNLGPSGFVVVIVRRDLLSRASPRCPSILSWKAHAESKPIPSIYNTPPVINLWLHDLTLGHYESIGGMQVMNRHFLLANNFISSGC